MVGILTSVNHGLTLGKKLSRYAPHVKHDQTPRW